MMPFMITFLITVPLLIAQNASWLPLFDGENLDGWTIVNGDKTTWVAQDNMIVTTGKPTGVIRTNKMYENFILELDWRHMVENGNAGLFVWSDPIPAIGVPFTRSIEVQIMDGKELDSYTTHGDIFSIWGAKMTPDDPHPMGEHIERCLPSERRSKPAPQWNHYIVTCIDGQINLSVNGAFVSGATNVTPRKGYLCLEAEGDPAQFKNIRIMELPPSAPKTTDVAKEDIGFVTLFNGLDITGWTTAYASTWTAADNVLHCKNGSDTITTTKTFGPYEMIVDYKLQEEDSTAYLVVDGQKTELPKAKAGSWNRYTHKGKGGHIGMGGKNVRFTNIFCRPLK
jgi:hypothetical protein